MLHTVAIIHNITILSHITGTKVIFGIYPLHHHAAVWGDDVEVDITTYMCMSCVCLPVGIHQLHSYIHYSY